MVSVNLLPVATVRKQTARQRARLWLLLVLAVAGGSAIPIATRLTGRVQAAMLQGRCENIYRERSATQDSLKRVVAQTQRLEHHLARSETLRTKRSWCSLLGHVGGSMPGEVWLTTIETDPPTPRGTGRVASVFGRKAAEENSVRLQAPTHIVLQGYAVDHKDLYAFMSQLKQGGAFDDVDLVRSGREPVLDGHAVQFELRCGWH
jgi:Tfp pilus assembly protein PilN